MSDIPLEFGVAFNTVSPGPIQTKMFDHYIEAKPEVLEDIRTSQPMGRVGMSEEVVSTVLWVCSDAASFVTGQAIAVDGGYTVQ